MKILVLEHPRFYSETRFNDIANTPLWSCLVGGYTASSLLAAGFDVDYIDASKDGWDYDRLGERIMIDQPSLVCINAVYIWEHTHRLFGFVAGLRKSGFRGHVNLFGFFPTLAYGAILANTGGIDSIAVGECEATITDLAFCLLRGEDYTAVSGLAVLHSGPTRLTRRREPANDPDRFPVPFRLDGPDDTVMILASRGCYNHCSFCPIPSYYGEGPLWRGRAPEKVAEEIARLREKGHKSFYFADPNFIGPGKAGRERTRRLLDLIEPLAVRFGMETRPNDLDEDMLERLAKAGLESLLIGVESGSEQVLGTLEKHAPSHVSERAIELCRRVGIEPEVGFLMFVPDSTIDDIRGNFNFLLSNNLLDHLDRTVNLLSHRQIILMGTSGYARFESRGRLVRAGFLGFEGEVSYRDERVKSLADSIIPVCLAVIRAMSEPGSPLYWGNDDMSAEKMKVNDNLVRFFDDMLTRTGAGMGFSKSPGDFVWEIIR